MNLNIIFEILRTKKYFQAKFSIALRDNGQLLLNEFI